MEFLAPLMLAGLAAVAIPIAIHLRGRRRARVVSFAAIDFLLGSDRKVARKLRLRELLLLAARIFVCLLIPLAFAKPLTSCQASGPDVKRGPQAVVLLVDDSLPTRYELDDGTIFSRVVGQARAIIDQLGPEADVAILRTSEGAPQPGEFSRDHMGMRDELAELRPTARPPDLASALSRAEALLENARHDRRTAFLISPLMAPGDPEEIDWPKDGPALEVVPIASDETFENLAVTDLEVEAAPSSGERGIRVTAEVQHFGSSPRQKEEIRLAVDGDVVARSFLALDPGERKRHSFLASLPRGQRTARVAVSLSGDALALDDSRHVVAELQEEVSVLLVNGDPSAVRYEDELFYARAALRPGDRGDAGVDLRTVTASELESAELDELDVVVLANVPALSESQVTRLARWVDEGGGLFVTAGDNVDPVEYDESMTPLLPQRLKSVQDVTYGHSGQERKARELGFGELDLDHPILGAFSADNPSLAQSTFSKLVLFGPTIDVDERRVIARYDSGAAALVEAARGEGRMLMFSSTLDRDWNNLAIFPGYPPLMQAIVRYLGRKQDLDVRRVVNVGTSTSLQLGASETRIELEHPGGRRERLEAEGGEEGRRARASEIREPGFYRISTPSDEGELVRDPSRDFAAQIDPRASSLHRVEVASIRGAAGGERGSRGTHERRVELWHALAAALLLFLLVEAVLVWRSS